MRYLLNRMANGVIRVMICLLMPTWTGLMAQDNKVSEKFSILLSEKKDAGKKADAGVKIFSDKDYVFDQLPADLLGMDFLVTSMMSDNVVIPVTEGYVYMVTPLDGEVGSQEKQLVEMGFIKAGHPGFKLFKEQQQATGLFQK